MTTGPESSNAKVGADGGDGRGAVAVTVGHGRGQGDEAVGGQADRVVGVGRIGMDHRPLLVERDVAESIDAHTEHQQVANRCTALDHASVQDQINCLAGGSIDKAGRTGSNAERKGDRADWSGAIGTERGGEHAGEAGCCVGGEVALVDRQHGLGGRGARHRRIVIDIDGERAGGAAAVDVGDGVGEGEALVVLVAASGMDDRRVLGDRIGTARRVEGDRQDRDAALLDEHATSTVRDVAEPRWRPGQQEGPG